MGSDGVQLVGTRDAPIEASADIQLSVGFRICNVAYVRAGDSDAGKDPRTERKHAKVNAFQDATRSILYWSGRTGTNRLRVWIAGHFVV